MPNKLDKKDLLFYQKVLSEIKEKIVSEIKKISSDASTPSKDTSGDISGHALHMADVATDMYDREFSLGLASNDRELLSKVELALKRIQEKTFGACEECHKPIAAARLKAIPYAQLCLKCQEKHESH
ncbi:MAG TPA: TraR/DksA family transcriptional regulator [Candidatus Omnitrophota bacterium]|nr:TraR/DksA family transcriptional regulator [Candidatus Omnitrophota bacterium]HPD84024.1 TraR/DksA family transcriptional regulator [Candidatus Omnitrophota bacterium]HRZ02881.1 TraR/DksA family transcriptional regulator [Candidatus Omnitrophota bacterium]